MKLSLIRRHAGLVSVLLAPLFGSAAGLLAPTGAGATVVGTNVNLPAPAISRQQIQQDFPHEVREPHYIPKGMSLFLVIPSEPSEAGESAYSVDLYYTADDGRAMHVWETDNASLAASGKDPTLSTNGEPWAVHGRAWIAERLPDRALTALSTRFGDGITVSFDGNLDDQTMRAVAASFPNN